MESGIDYKGLLFVFDDNTSSIKVWQGETTKTSKSGFVSDYIVKFLIWKNELYALRSSGELYQLINMVSGDVDNWSELADASETVSDMVLYNGNIYIIGSTQMFYWNGANLTTSTSLPANHTYYCGVSSHDKIFLYGDDNTYNIVDEYDGSSFTELFSSNSEAMISYSFYNVKGKPLIIEYKGKLYFNYRNATAAETILVSYDISSGKTTDNLMAVSEYPTSMIIEDGIITMSMYIYDRAIVRVYIIDDYIKEKEISLGNSDKIGKLYRIESDPILASSHDKERLVYYPQYTCIGNVSGAKPIFKYGKRLECYTDLYDANIGNVSLKEIADNLCNLLDAYVSIKPENIIETDMKDLSGKSDIFLTLSDSDDYGDLQIHEIEDYIQGSNNFRRIMIGWENKLMEGGKEIVGTSGLINVNEFSYDSTLVNNSNTAKNIAEYLFSKMYSGDEMVCILEYAPFLRVNQNVSVKAIGSNLYLGDKKEFKIVGIDHSWDSKTTKLNLIERNIIFNNLEI